MSYWIELREPGCVPELKGAFPGHTFVKTLREFMEARPRALMTVITITDGYPLLQDAPEALQMADGRMRHVARRHIESTRLAFANGQSE